MRIIQLILISALTISVLSGCARTVTTQTEVIDTRPVVSFVVKVNTAGMHLFVDDLDQGALSNYQYPSSAIRLLPGQHKIEIKQNGKVLFTDARYFSEGIDYKIDVTIQL
ncbi:hypothetical protein [Aliidiomarina quisquiliarum]|uniref:hypothetical protein n=1 Tax=Aliidiomarina quisquiliarum TaxID=2938947 RepID=UPI00208F2CC7|nr:hypothetical protein [Aliidiomarina quisquiliarum]MCO4322583.1 hypothetical protein [Aliidiomarina quisquiliarum]